MSNTALPSTPGGGRGAQDPTRWPALAASPTFAMMALQTLWAGDDPLAMLCSDSHGAVLGGMAPMYLLMALFHARPWLRHAAERLARA